MRNVSSVFQYGKSGNILREYQFVGIYPTEVSTIGLDWGNEAIEEFTVSFTYDHWKVVSSRNEAGASTRVQQLSNLNNNIGPAG